MSRIIVGWAVVVVLTIGCAARSSIDPNFSDGSAVNDGGTSATSAIGLRLAASRFDQEFIFVPTNNPRRIFFRAEIEVSNLRSESPVRVGRNGFSLVTTNGREVRPEDGTSCGPTDSRVVLVGASTRCTLEFEITGLTARALLFTSGVQSSQITVPSYVLATELAPRSACERVLARRDVARCGSCLSTNCVSARDSYATCHNLIIKMPPEVRGIRATCDRLADVGSCSQLDLVSCVEGPCADACQP
jgi:hypothetical protein